MKLWTIFLVAVAMLAFVFAYHSLEAEDSHVIIHNSSALMLSVNTAVVDSTDLQLLSDMAVILEQAIVTDTPDPYEYVAAAWCYDIGDE